MFWAYAYGQNLDFNLMNSQQLTASKVTPRLMYITLLSALFAAAIGDHLASPSLTNLGAPAERGNACAPCGAPCVEPKPEAD